MYYHTDPNAHKGNEMKSVRINSCSFGTLIINGKPYTDDLIIHPDGKILKPWRCKKGHQLSMDDLRELIDLSPGVIVAGTGMSGGVIPDRNLEEDLSKLAIEFIAAPNEKAIKVFNELVLDKRVGAGFHLTC